MIALDPGQGFFGAAPTDAKIKYHSPINGDIECQGEVNEVDRDAFCSSYKKLGKSKLELTINVGRLPNAILQGSYFAVSRF